MKKTGSILVAVLSAAFISQGADKKKPNWGYSDTPKLPSGWCVHDIDRPQPEVVTPAEKIGQPPFPVGFSSHHKGKVIPHCFPLTKLDHSRRQVFDLNLL